MSSESLRSFAARAVSTARRYQTPLIVATILLVLGLFISQNRGEVSRIADIVRGADPAMLGLAMLANAAVVAAAGLNYRIVLNKLGHSQPWAWLANLHLKRHIVGTVTPVGGPASVYVFVRMLGNRGVQTSDALFAAAIRSVCGYAGFMLILVPVILVNRPPAYILAGAAVLLVLLLLLASSMLLLLRESCNPGWLMSRLHPRLLQVVETARGHQLAPVDFVKPLVMAIIHNSLGILTLYLSLLAVGYQGSLTTAVVAYAIGNLFMIVAPVFQGVGVVELTMAVALQQLGVPVPAAIAATILFRFCDIWFPCLLGIVTHAPQVKQVRQVAARTPALVTTSVGLLILSTPFLPKPDLSVLWVPEITVPLLAAVAGSWLLLMSRALWRRRPVGQIGVYGAFIVLIPLLAFLTPGLLQL